MRVLLILMALSGMALGNPERLRLDVKKLAFERNLDHPAALEKAAQYLEHELRLAGYQPSQQVFKVDGKACRNIIAERKGTDDVILVGAHYDSVKGCPGANDNASGCAALLALARHAPRKWDRKRPTLRFVFFVNEEPPYFQQEGEMGSLVYAAAHHKHVKAMLALETMGCYSDKPGSQKAPPGLPSDTTVGDFIALVGHPESAALAKTVLAAYASPVKMREFIAPDLVPGIGWSDHWSFWKRGVPALMVTDTAPFRYPQYHTAQDTWEKLDYDKLHNVVEGIQKVVEALTRP